LLFSGRENSKRNNEVRETSHKKNNN